MATINKEPKDNSAAQAVVASIFASTTSNEVAVQQEKELAVFGAEVFDDFDSDIVTTSSDFIVPRLKLMQAGSEAVKEGNAQMREYRSNTGTLLAKADEKLEVIVFKRDKYWTISEVDSDGKRVVGGIFRREAFTLDNQKAPYEFEEDGKSFQRTLVYDFYVLKADQDPKEVMKNTPLIYSLSSSASRVAREWYSKFTELKTQGKSPISQVFELGSFLEKKNGNSWLLPTVAVGRPTTKEEQESAIFWRLSFQNREYKVHEEAGDQA